jgi:flavin reductase (DIM6/NTAB) family NADH-FMN oxidoreductase RutF
MMGEISATHPETTAVKKDLRSAMRHFATGVCVVSTFTDTPSGRRHSALTVNSLASLSLEPPLVSLSIRRGSGFLDDLMASRLWAVSVLDAGSADLARIFARPEAERRRALDSLPAEPGPHTGALLLDSVAWLECRYWNHVPAGDHELVIGEVVGLGIRDSLSPLIFLHGGFHRLVAPTTGNR